MPALQALHYSITHLCGAEQSSVSAMNVCGAESTIQCCPNRVFNGRSFLFHLKRVTQHQRRTCNCCERIRKIFSGNRWSGTVDWFIEPDGTADRCGREHSDRSC